MANDKPTIAELSGFDAAMELKERMQREQAATDPRRVGGVPARALPPSDVVRRADEIVPKQ